MSVKVKPPLFVGKPDDKLVVVDVYGGGETPDGPTNLLESISDVTGGAIKKALGINTNAPKLFKTAADAILSGKSFKPQDFAKTVLGEVFPNAKAALSDLKGGLEKTLKANLGIDSTTALGIYRSVKDGDLEKTLDTLAGSNPLAKLYIDGKEIIKKAEDIDSLSDLFGVAGAIFGQSSIGVALNLNEEFKALKGLVDVAVALRAPELADYLIDKVDNSNKEKLKQAILIKAAAVGDVNTVFGYIYRLNVAEAIDEEPDILTNFISNYRYPDATGASVETLNMVTAILTEFKPDWNGAISGRPDLSVWLDASRDLKEMFLADGRYAHLVVCAEGLRIEPIGDILKTTMDWVPLKTDNRINLI